LSALKKLFENHTAGCPVAGVKLTHLSTRELTNELAKQGHAVCDHVVKRLLVEQKLGHRSSSKSQTIKDDVPNRNEQFVKVSKLRNHYISRGYTVLSMDVKKKEETGRFHRPGKV
jgi:adenylate kinase family enzyme